jgi:hypothetical protein
LAITHSVRGSLEEKLVRAGEQLGYTFIFCTIKTIALASIQAPAKGSRGEKGYSGEIKCTLHHESQIDVGKLSA